MDDDVAKLARDERLTEAAELAASRGDARAACDLFERACAWDRASEEAARAGDDARALLLAVLGGNEARANEWVTRAARSKSATDAAHAKLVLRGEHAWDARLLEGAGRIVDAANAWDRAGDAVRAATLLERAGDVIAAARALESAARREPKRVDVSLALGDLLLRFGKTEEAVRALQRIDADAPERRRALTLLARAFETLGLTRAKVDADAELASLGGPIADASTSIAVGASGAPVRARLFGRYEVVREVASSASARVVECTDPVRGEHVAVKIFAGYDHGARAPQLDARGAGRDALARFEREVKVLAQLSHPNVVPLRDYVPDGPAIVLAWMSGGTLDARLAESSLTPARANEIACAVLSALGEAHRLGVIHRDVKPANVLFDDAGVARLSDFGVAHLGDLSATATAGVIGTLAYMSPEQREGRPATVQSDVFAVGAILLEMLTGERLRASDAVAARPSGAHRDLDARHDDVVLRMIDPDPASRPIDAFAARRALLALPWPDANEPAAPRAKAAAKSDHPQAGRADLLPDGTGFDRWIARPFEHAPLDERSLARASAFARAPHAALQAILRVDHDTSRIWLERLAGRPLDGPLTRAQATSLEQALTALHAAGVAHGHVDRAHVTIDEHGTAILRFTPSCDATSTIDRDRLALARLESASP